MKFINRNSAMYTTYVKVGGISTKVCFNNPLGNNLGRGELFTSDDKLIDALLKDERYDKDWFAANESEAKAFLAKVESITKSRDKATKGSKTVSDKGSAELGLKGASGGPGVAGVKASELSAEDLKDLQGDVSVVGNLGVNGKKEDIDTSEKKEGVIGATEGEANNETRDDSKVEDSVKKEEADHESKTSEIEEIVVHSIPEARKILTERGCTVGIPSYDKANEEAEKLGIKLIFKKNGENGDNQ